MGARAIVAASALLLLAIAWLFVPASEPATRLAAEAPIAQVPQPSAAAKASAPGLETGVSDEWSEKDAPALVLQRFRKVKDKRAFFDRALTIGGGTHLYAALAAFEECERVNDFGMVGAEQQFAAQIPASDPAHVKRINAFRAAIAGCEGFETRPISTEKRDALLNRLVESPDPIGIAMGVVPFSRDVLAAKGGRDLLLPLVETADPYVIQLLIIPLAWRAAGFESSADLRGDSPKVAALSREINAWKWALCDLGLDCAPTGAQGLQVCYRDGLCDWNTIGDIVPSQFELRGSKAGVSAVRKDEIVAAVRAHDWAKLGL